MNKSWYASKTIWGGIIMVVATVLQIAGVASVSAEEQATLIEGIVNVASVVGQLFGAILAIYGRIRVNR